MNINGSGIGVRSSFVSEVAERERIAKYADAHPNRGTHTLGAATCSPKCDAHRNGTDPFGGAVRKAERAVFAALAAYMAREDIDILRIGPE